MQAGENPPETQSLIMSNLKTSSTIAAEIEKLYAEHIMDSELERIRVDMILQQLEQRIRKLEENTSGKEGGLP